MLTIHNFNHENINEIIYKAEFILIFYNFIYIYIHFYFFFVAFTITAIFFRVYSHRVCKCVASLAFRQTNLSWKPRYPRARMKCNEMYDDRQFKSCVGVNRRIIRVMGCQMETCRARHLWTRSNTWKANRSHPASRVRCIIFYPPPSPPSYQLTGIVFVTSRERDRYDMSRSGRVEQRESLQMFAVLHEIGCSAQMTRSFGGEFCV